ncbi:hypothetical protein Vi05172_g3136 [Venturia inaequalis]|nr:hypothetical protein Vi05172_g3136 [Venturia inaequalis]
MSVTVVALVAQGGGRLSTSLPARMAKEFRELSSLYEAAVRGRGQLGATIPEATCDNRISADWLGAGPIHSAMAPETTKPRPRILTRPPSEVITSHSTRRDARILILGSCIFPAIHHARLRIEGNDGARHWDAAWTLEDLRWLFFLLRPILLPTSSYSRLATPPQWQNPMTTTKRNRDVSFTQPAAQIDAPDEHAASALGPFWNNMVALMSSTSSLAVTLPAGVQ